ncbi:GGDEF domain-containing protein [Pseudooceanicola nanhaiensis]|uniref:GGDEF domain-containing protein n=1 Tax=Pseudooceanicola nanhaiensis TaxID=375761 RepID=UPI001CD3F629|nr:GGDEF domain-containing protein [Pseudooceanicola nanhaiensis]MCA0920106.1 diguanylate cyclase [Pseudooceanicola nanhaiensis]
MSGGLQTFGPHGPALSADGLCDLRAVFDLLCPMHVVLDETGHIRHVGPTIQKLWPGQSLAGSRFLEVFELARPRAVTSMQGLMAAAGRKLHLGMRAAPRTALKGILLPLEAGGAVVNLSFGLSVQEAVRAHHLTGADFPPTDLTVELLYLLEANAMVTEAFTQLSLRLQGAMIAAEEQAFTDTLTGLKNRRAMDHVLARAVAQGQPFALMHVDLDYFKDVNDSLGHAAGDHVLQHVARKMLEVTRDEDTVARIGGDEFVLILNNLQSRRRIEEIARTLLDRLQEPIPYQGRPCRIAASIGTVLSSEYDSPDVERLMKDSDAALYTAKRGGRAQHVFASHSVEG